MSGGRGPPGRRGGGEAPRIEQIYRGRVTRVCQATQAHRVSHCFQVEQYGCFVKLEGVDSRDGLVHVSQYSKTGDHSDPREGDNVWVKVLEIEEAQGDRGMRIRLTMDCVDQTTGRDMDPSNSSPEEFAIYRGVVTRVQPFGAFVRLSQFRGKEGLVHVSQMADHRVEKVEDIVDVGDEVCCWVRWCCICHPAPQVYVKVISLGEETDGKISLSMKYAQLNTA